MDTIFEDSFGFFMGSPTQTLVDWWRLLGILVWVLGVLSKV